MAKQFELGKHKCFFVSEILERAEVYLCSSLPDELVASFGFKPFHSWSEVTPRGQTVVLPRATATLPQISG